MKKTVLAPLDYVIIRGAFFVYQKTGREKDEMREEGRKSMKQPLILASASPRRRELMAYTGLPFEVICADAEEIKTGEPDVLVMENARRKARAVAALHPGRMVLAADTVVYQDGRVLGKPRDEQDARNMLRRLSGNTHTVYTGVCVIDADGREAVNVDASRVEFVVLSEEAISWYIATGEPMDKAGAYAVQGRAGMFVRSISGSYSNVIGLPMALVRDMLRDAGADIP